MRRASWAIIVASSLCGPASAQSVLFTFDDAPLRSPLPVTLTVGGITATLSGAGQGYSIQEASVLGFTPAGFSGLCVYPSSVFAADLLVAFSRPLTAFSILYAPEEYACDSSARMRVTADMDGTVVGSNTTTAEAGTWPTATLAFSSAQTFNHVVIHYDAPPPTGGDWGPIFMVDDMSVTPSAEVVPLQVPGDANGDGILDLSDAVALLEYLFLGSSRNLPCGDGSSTDPGNVSLLDWQPDGAIDISDAVASLNFLFLGAPRHTLAVVGTETTGCVPIPGCPSLCAG